MSNTIVIELCAEDRERLDRLAEAMERKACDKCVATAMEFAKLRMEQAPEKDPIQQKLAATLAKAKEPVEATAAPPLKSHQPRKHLRQRLTIRI